MFDVTFESAFPLRMFPDTLGKTHIHDLYEIFYVASGLMITVNHDESSFCTAGQFQIEPAGLFHARGNPGESSAETLCLRWECRDPRLPGEPRVIEDSRGYLPALLRMMIDLHPAEGNDASENLDILTQAALYEIIILEEAAHRKLTAQVRSFVLNRLAENLSLEDLAGAADLSPSHFSRLFKAETGRTPMNYVRELRANAAVQLLRHTSLKLHAIARNVGFVDASHLSKAVREFHNASPGELRGKSFHDKPE